jgi:CDP-diacylglycerol--glycerol-3-phosphate 3-phosphatidyltransferase
LGDTAGLLKVTQLAKWKTTAQMTAIAVLFLAMGLEYVRETNAMRADVQLIDSLRDFGTDDINLVDVATMGGNMVWQIGLGMIWIAALLTVITGFDYFRKALPHLLGGKA